MSKNPPNGIIKTDIGYDDLSTDDKATLQTALRRGTSRRELMGWLMASGATLMAAGSIVSGAKSALAATPKTGGSLRFAWDLHGPSDTLDPILFTSSIDYGRGRLNYNNLTRLREDLTATSGTGGRVLRQRRRHRLDLQAAQER